MFRFEQFDQTIIEPFFTSRTKVTHQYGFPTGIGQVIEPPKNKFLIRHGSTTFRGDYTKGDIAQQDQKGDSHGEGNK